MYIDWDTSQVQGGSGFEPWPGADGREQGPVWPGDVVDISEEAVRAFREAAIEPIKHGTFSLDRLEARISVVRAEIAHIWGSALPDDEKELQISARENEIALLQAGQFAFARAGFPLSV
ncbi:hypothetical protein DND132_1699 [Pseudodesulfovibrio mercurii]|uniref:Uncharacterized protein n=1 Tax=Pseudodesulfovibrio mercurii TaxID=641491 RepID=F0JFI1_9BACT|nr:hypothetical protein [Pseudodesulfovibrio mercurii]EGB14905.1 hypothetical protein DND132_1699 [Pseudodesulfovibrio mercurii]